MDLQQLSDLWEIQKLKARYFRCMDLRLWDEFRDVFTDDLELYIENTKTPQAQTPTVNGADALVAYLSVSDPRKVTIHQGHMPEIEFLDADHATGIWAMFDWVDDPGRGLAAQGFGHYHERYVRCPDGKWRISSVRLTRLRANKVPHLESDQLISLDRDTLASVAHLQRPSQGHHEVEPRPPAASAQ
jgi:SnoaL-like domain